VQNPPTLLSDRPGFIKRFEGLINKRKHVHLKRKFNIHESSSSSACSQILKGNKDEPEMVGHSKG
jgi:hypothetical protein